MKTYAIHTGHTTANGSNISDEISQTLNRDSAPAIVHLPHGSGGGLMTDDSTAAFPINTLTLGGRPDPVNDARMTMGVGDDGDPQFMLSKAHSHAVATKMQVRRLTPTECERLQGFPDGHTAIIYKGKPAADGPRYKALGNSMAVNCMSWIGQRIQLCDEVIKEVLR